MVTKKSLLNVSFFVVTEMINQKQLLTRLFIVNLALSPSCFFDICKFKFKLSEGSDTWCGAPVPYLFGTIKLS